MKVLYVGSSTQIHSGAAQWMFRLADGMRERGVETLAVLPDEEGIAEWYDEADVAVVTAWSGPVRRFESLLAAVRFLVLAVVATTKLAWLVRRRDVDVVHVNEIRYPWALLGARLGGAAVVCHVRMIPDDDRVRRLLARWTLALSHQVVCVSEATRERTFPTDPAAVVTIHDGAPDPDRFDDRARVASAGGDDGIGATADGETDSGSAFRDEFDVDPDAVLVLSVSKLTRTKGQDRLLDAAEALRSTHPEVVVALVGGEVEGHEDYAAELRARAADLDNVRLTGFHPDVAAAYAAADVVVHVPRHEDPFPGVVLEGLLAGAPVIGSRSGGIPEQVDDGETGLLVPRTGGHDDLVAAIADLATDRERRVRMGERGARRVLERFDPDAYLDDVAAVYASVTAAGSSEGSSPPAQST